MGFVYHYTSPEGVLGILKNRTLWFTDCEFMNDPAELKYCHDLYNRAWVEVCRERGMSEAQIGREITKHANPYMCESIASEAVGAYVPARYYVLSTCLNGDDPAMWANYANKEGKAGYSLEFDRDKLIQTLEELVSESSKFGIYVEVLYDSVCYNEEEQFEDIKSAIRKYLHELDGALSSSSNELDCVIDSETVRSRHWSRFEDYAPFIKRPELAFEREYRFVLKMAQIDQPSSEHDSLDGGQVLDNEECERTSGSPIALKFREGLAGESIPYLEVKLGEAMADVLSATRRQSRAEERSANEAKEDKEKKEDKGNIESEKHRIIDMGDVISMLCAAWCIFCVAWQFIDFGLLDGVQKITGTFEIEWWIVWLGAFANASAWLIGAALCLWLKREKRLVWTSGVRVVASISIVCVVRLFVGGLAVLLALYLAREGTWKDAYPVVCWTVVCFGWIAFKWIALSALLAFLPDDRQSAG